MNRQHREMKRKELLDRVGAGIRVKDDILKPVFDPQQQAALTQIIEGLFEVIEGEG